MAFLDAPARTKSSRTNQGRRWNAWASSNKQNIEIKANKNLSESTNNNDWEMMGKDLKSLQELIQKLEVVVEKNEINTENKVI